MKMISSVARAVVLTGVLGVTGAGSALAEPVWNGEVFGDWRFECAARAEGLTQCALVQTIINIETNQTILRLSFARSDVDGSIMASVLLPLGVELAENAMVSTGAEQISLPYRTCLMEGCLGRRAMASEELLRFSAAKSLSVVFYVVGDDEPALTLASSRGLAEAFGRLGYVSGE